MENNNNHDKYFRDMLSGNGREMPFSDFEDKLMSEICREHERNNSFIKNIKLSWLFFFLGLVSGIVLVIITPGFSESYADLDGDLLYGAIIFICLFILLFAEKLFRLSFNRHN
ncbi:MAG: hypothetical protein JRJ57_08200 [Deltaproteobacteria bacterium]|nr:hypothetical protein [Deltaproteobacteria bacterium]HDZ40104.1 hypothetical protein [Bacteroidota bacterium]